MKKVNVRKMFLVVAIFAIVCCVSTVNYATDVNDLIQNITELEPGNVPIVDINANNNTDVENIGTIGGTNTNTPTNSTELPKTGVDDTIMWVLIAVSAVAAIYTYRKVRDYNV